MINKFNLAKALFDNSKAIATANGLKLVADGESYSPDPNTSYIKEFVLFGDDDPIGISDNSSDIQLGVYQLNVYTPKAEEGAKWNGLQISGLFQAGFSRGVELVHGGQMVRIRNASLFPMDQDQTHLLNILSIQFSVIN